MKGNNMKEDIERVLISEEELKKRVAELGAQISADYAGKEPLLVSVLRGSYIFMADLTRSIDCFCRVDFMAVSSYGSGTVSSGQVIYSTDEVTQALKDFKDADFILIDTAGHSYHNSSQKDTMNEFVHSVDGLAEKEVYLVLSATTKYKDLISVADT